MASETVDPIDWSHPSPSWAVPPEQVVHSINQCSSATAGIRSCNLATFSMRGNHLAYAATQGKGSDCSQVLPNTSQVSPINRQLGFYEWVWCADHIKCDLCVWKVFLLYLQSCSSVAWYHDKILASISWSTALCLVLSCQSWSGVKSLVLSCQFTPWATVRISHDCWFSSRLSATLTIDAVCSNVVHDIYDQE